MIGSDLEGAVLESRVATVVGVSSYWNARRPLEDHAGHVPAVAGAVMRGLLRQLAHPLAVAEHHAAPAVTLIYLPVQGPCR